MRFDEGANKAAEQAAELVNLVREDALDAAAFHSLREVSDEPGPVDADVLARLVDLGHALAPVFSGAEPRGTVNALLAQVRVTPHVTDHDDRGPHLHFEPPGAGVAERFEANALMGLAALLCDDHQRLGTCAAEGCRNAWVDTSRNARRRFCSPACANRTHVAAHRARRRGA